MNESDYRARRLQFEVPIGPPRHTDLRALGTKDETGVTAGGPDSISLVRRRPPVADGHELLT